MHLGAVHRLDAALGNGSFIRLGEQVIDGVVVEHIGTEHLFNHMARGFALAEARNVVFTGLAFERFGNCGVERFGVNGELQFMAVVFKFFVFDEIHCISSNTELTEYNYSIRL